MYIALFNQYFFATGHNVIPPHFFLSEKHNFSICVMLLLAFSPFLTSDCS